MQTDTLKSEYLVSLKTGQREPSGGLFQELGCDGSWEKPEARDPATGQGSLVGMGSCGLVTMALQPSGSTCVHTCELQLQAQPLFKSHHLTLDPEWFGGTL